MQSRRKFCVKAIATLIGLLISFLNGCPVGGAGAIKWKTFLYPKLGFQIDFPESWKVTERDTRTFDNWNFPDVQGISPLSPGSVAPVEVSVKVTDPNEGPIRMTLWRAVENRKGGLRMLAKGATIAESTEVPIAGRQGFKTTWTDGNMGERSMYTCYDFDSDTSRYVIAISMRQADLPKYSDEVNAIVRSFNLTVYR